MSLHLATAKRRFNKIGISQGFVCRCVGWYVEKKTGEVFLILRYPRRDGLKGFTDRALESHESGFTVLKTGLAESDYDLIDLTLERLGVTKSNYIVRTTEMSLDVKHKLADHRGEV